MSFFFFFCDGWFRSERFNGKKKKKVDIQYEDRQRRLGLRPPPSFHHKRKLIDCGILRLIEKCFDWSLKKALVERLQAQNPSSPVLSNAIGFCGVGLTFDQQKSAKRQSSI